MIGPAWRDPCPVLGAPLALVVDTLSYLVSATLIWRIRAHEGLRARRPPDEPPR